MGTPASTRRRARRNLSPGHETVLSVLRRVDVSGLRFAVFLANLGRLPGQVESFEGLGGRDHVQGLGGERIHGGQLGVVIHLPAQGIKCPAQLLPGLRADPRRFRG